MNWIQEIIIEHNLKLVMENLGVYEIPLKLAQDIAGETDDSK